MASREYRVKVVLTKAGESWDSTKTYALLDYIAQTDGVVYVSKKADNTGHELTDTDWWDKVLDLNTYITAMQTATAACTEATEKATEAAERVPTIWANVLAVKDCAINVDGNIVELPAHKNVVIKDFKNIRVVVNNQYYSPEYITRFDIHYNDLAAVTGFSCASYGTPIGQKAEYYAMSSLTTLNFSGTDFAGITYARMMFYKMLSLTSLDVSGWDTSKMTDMLDMFANCSSLTSLDVSGWDTSSVTNMAYMFRFCSSLSDLDVSNWDTSSVTDMTYMFASCSSLTSLDLSNFDTSKVTNMSYMLAYCSVLTNLIFGSKWGTQTSTAANALTLDLSSCGSSKSYKLTDETYNSMLTMYDRKAAGLTEMTIKLRTKHNIPDGWTDKMVARGYTIVLV